MRAPCLFIVGLLLLLPVGLRAQSDETLDIYFIDTEGGQSTLFVTPAGESVLIDAGNAGERDAGRILATLREAGVQRIDHMLLTHYHGDHFGSIPALAAQLPIGHFIDHGPSVESNQNVGAFEQAYREMHSRARRTIVKPGDRLTIPGLEWTIVSAAGSVLTETLPGAGQPNSACPAERPAPNLGDENANSTGSVIRFGEFTTIDLGDLLIPQELDLVCPANRLGTVDLYITSHHGLNTSGSAALVHALHPRVAIMNNGTRKGGTIPAFQVLHSSPGLEDLWQLHWSHSAGIELNAPGVFIANIDEPADLAAVVGAAGGNAPRPAPHNGPANVIHVEARRDGSFTVTNERNGFRREYP